MQERERKKASTKYVAHTKSVFNGNCKAFSGSSCDVNWDLYCTFHKLKKKHKQRNTMYRYYALLTFVNLIKWLSNERLTFSAYARWIIFIKRSWNMAYYLNHLTFKAQSKQKKANCTALISVILASQLRCWLGSFIKFMRHLFVIVSG